MMKKPYCCEASRQMFDQYYDQQQRGNGNFPVYIGRSNQRGHGLGNIIGGLFRKILPFFKAVAPHALRAGANIVEDISGGRSWKESVFSRVPESINAFTSKGKNQSGSGALRRKKSKKRPKAKRRRKDIFSR